MSVYCALVDARKGPCLCNKGDAKHHTHGVVTICVPPIVFLRINEVTTRSVERSHYSTGKAHFWGLLRDCSHHRFTLQVPDFRIWKHFDPSWSRPGVSNRQSMVCHQKADSLCPHRWSVASLQAMHSKRTLPWRWDTTWNYQVWKSWLILKFEPLALAAISHHWLQTTWWVFVAIRILLVLVGDFNWLKIMWRKRSRTQKSLKEA